MSKRTNFLLLEDMLDSSLKIKKYTNGLDLDGFLNDEKTIDAVTRNFEIIGEAASRLDEDFKQVHSQIDWVRLRGFRNRIVHEYFGVDLEIVWTIIEDDIEPLIESLGELLQK